MLKLLTVHTSSARKFEGVTESKTSTVADSLYYDKTVLK